MADHPSRADPSKLKKAGKRTSGRWPALAALYFAMLAVKLLWIGFALAIPWFVGSFLRSWEEISGKTFSDYHVSTRYLVAFIILTVLTSIAGMWYAHRAAAVVRDARNGSDEAPAFRKLVISWALLDTICVYGILSKILRYNDLWCYGFVAVSTALTILAGYPLLGFRKNERETPRAKA